MLTPGQAREEHWNCPFFQFCWDHQLTLPEADDCPLEHHLVDGPRYEPEERHWLCPFFQHCWEKRLRLPLAKECPKDHHRTGRQERSTSPKRARGTVKESTCTAEVEESTKAESSAKGKAPQKEDKSEETNVSAKDDTCHEQKPMLPKWCPDGLTRSQKRRLQRLRADEQEETKREQERDRVFNELRPMTIPPKKIW